MTRSDLIAVLAARFPDLTHTDVDVSVKIILTAIVDALTRGARVEIRDFGSFSVRQRPARAGRNPSTGQSIRVPAKCVPHFRTGKHMRDRVVATAPHTTDEPHAAHTGAPSSRSAMLKRSPRAPHLP